MLASFFKVDIFIRNGSVLILIIFDPLFPALTCLFHPLDKIILTVDKNCFQELQPVLPREEVS